MSAYHGQERRDPPEECAEFETWRSTAGVFNRRLEAIERLTQSMHEHLIDHISQESKTQQAIIDLLETWHGARFTVRVVKWLAPILAAVGALVLWAKDHIR